MDKEFTLETANIVVLARNYNPSIVSKEWLFDKNIIRGTVSNFVHSPLLSVVDTNKFSFVLDENRLQLSLKNITTGNMKMLPKIAKDFVACLPETPYVAVGFNYRYQLPKEKSQIKLWFNPDYNKLKNIFTENYEVGFIISFRFEGFVTRISAPPTKREDTNLALAINSHLDCRGVDAVTDGLSLYDNNIEKIESILVEMCK